MTAEVTILMAVHNGETYLPSQLESIAKQTHENWTLIAGDDLSTDSSWTILQDFQSGRPNVQVHDIGIGHGPECFMELLRRAGGAEYIAFSDQDDVWLPDRLSRGLEALGGLEDAPTLYCSRTWVVDENLACPRLSPSLSRRPSFRNALIQNIAAGNTILLNRAASKLATEAAQEAGPVVAHDWWIYQLITGVGGRVIFDDHPTLLYRQHRNNSFGTSKSFRGRAVRLIGALCGCLKIWNDANLRALKSSAHRLTSENIRLLIQFEEMRRKPPFKRLAELKRLGLYRQVRIDNVMIPILAILGQL